MADERDLAADLPDDEPDALAILDMVEAECVHGWFLPGPVRRVAAEIRRLRALVAGLEAGAGDAGRAGEGGR